MRLHSLFLSEWKETPNYDVIFTDSPTSAIRFCTFCRMNRYLERFSFLHTQPFAAARQIACRIRTYGIPSSVYMFFHFFRITHNACRLRLPRIWNPSLNEILPTQHLGLNINNNPLELTLTLTSLPSPTSIITQIARLKRFKQPRLWASRPICSIAFINRVALQLDICLCRRYAYITDTCIQLLISTNTK